MIKHCCFDVSVINQLKLQEDPEHVLNLVDYLWHLLKRRSASILEKVLLPPARYILCASPQEAEDSLRGIKRRKWKTG